MPSRILEICAEDGSVVAKGDPILILESMKTVSTTFSPCLCRNWLLIERQEIRIVAQTAGTVKMLVVEGEVCSEGTVLCEVIGGEDE